jgi:hypothetical protein
MGQYVMALYRQLILHLRRPSHCGQVSFMERMLVERREMLAAGSSVAVFDVVPGCLAVNARPQLELARAEAQGLPIFTQPR